MGKNALQFFNNTAFPLCRKRLPQWGKALVERRQWGKACAAPCQWSIFPSWEEALVEGRQLGKTPADLCCRSPSLAIGKDSGIREQPKSFPAASLLPEPVNDTCSYAIQCGCSLLFTVVCSCTYPTYTHTVVCSVDVALERIKTL